MIIICHTNNSVLKVRSTHEKKIDFNKSDAIATVIKKIASTHRNEIVFWYDLSVEACIDFKSMPSLFKHNKVLMSYDPSNNNFSQNKIGYVDLSVFIKVNKSVTYPTWLMSGTVGGVHADVINGISDKIIFDTDFDYFLNSMAKLIMPLGIFCYSEPKLLKSTPELNEIKNSLFKVFRFTKQHYKIQWVLLLFFNLFIYEKRIAILPLFCSLFYKKRKVSSNVYKNINFNGNTNFIKRKSVDVIIPTIGRKNYLFDVLQDLSKQSILPNKVIIVEQNPNINSVSDLDYLNDTWPFTIDHTFTHQTGACNARNIALSKIESEWVFFADDDIRFDESFIDKCFVNVATYFQNAITVACLRNKDKIKSGTPFQWGFFGSGCSFVNRKVLDNLFFNMQYEFGFGEDAEFGMQLRNTGTDILYCYTPSLLHLKAPIGGFRTKHVHPWDIEIIKPKPSPTVMLFETVHKTEEQVHAYKTMLFVKYYTRQSIKNPIAYFKMFQKKWAVSKKWCNHIKSSCLYEV
jgi:glycosyltransferase involved in cell wall biosynthesis